MDRNEPYTYEQAGFNGFMLRSMKSNSGANTLRAGISASSQNISFDRNQIEGQMGDSFSVGRVNINGRAGNITFSDDEAQRAILGFPDEDR